MRERDPYQRVFEKIDAALKQHQVRLEQLERRPFQAAGASASMPDVTKDLREAEVRYANTLVLLGYGGFFALWISTHERIPDFWFGAAGLLMAISVLFFVGWELVKTISNSLVLRRSTVTDKRGTRALTTNEQIELLNKNADRLNANWLWAFIPAAVTGLLAGAIVIWQFTLFL